MTVTFFVNGSVLAGWTPRVPAVKARLRLDDAALSVALLGPAVGSLLAMVLAGGLSARYGSCRVTRCSLVAFCLAVPLVGLAPSLPSLFAALALWGAFMGALDVSMNAQGVAVERA
ncbi:MAG TPA: MFS transporter, partial [Frankiaceae bacterium]|nr:MFS transporter [Frankiaceae bacterium]